MSYCTHYRYTARNEGIFAAGKRFIPPEFKKEAEIAEKWLPTPRLSQNGSYCFFWTEKGKRQYEQTLLTIHRRFLRDIRIEEFFQDELPGEVVYTDEWQVAVRVPAEKNLTKYIK